MADNDQMIALFVDFENIALGLRDTANPVFDIDLIIDRLMEKGKVVTKKAYCDWERYQEYKRPFHEAAIEMIDIPMKKVSGKNSADIRMVVDALDLCHVKGSYITTFALASGDSDFSPLVSKLRENGKSVIGIGVKNSTSGLLIHNCDEFIFYEDLTRSIQEEPSVAGLPKKKQQAFRMLVDAIKALHRANKEVLWGSMVKQTIQRKRPEFNEEYFGYSSFSELLEDAESHGVLRLRKDARSGSWIVVGFDGGRRSG